MNEKLVETVAQSANSEWFSQALNNGLWVFVGIIAGTLVNLLAVFILYRLKNRKIKKNIKFEISFNLSKIQAWKGFLDEVIEASNSDNMEDLLVLFDFQKIILWTVNKTISDGAVYDFLDLESIVALQKFGDFCAPFYSTKINEEIEKFKENPDRTGVAKMVKFWKKLLDEHEARLKLIESKL